MKDILVPTSPGELIDKMTILQIKSERMSDADKLQNVRYEADALAVIAAAGLPDNPALPGLRQDLYQINAALWQIEDDIRDCEAASDFGDTFVALARAVYRTNDKRAAIKKQINTVLGSALVEEKSYASPDTKKATQ